MKGLKGANLVNYADDSNLYAYNKNLETIISNQWQEFSIFVLWHLYGAESKLFGFKENATKKFQVWLLIIIFPLMSILLISSKQLTENSTLSVE